MKTFQRPDPRCCNAPGGNPAAGWTLIEALGVLAILAVLSAAFVPWLLRDLDASARAEESRALAEISRAIGQSLRRERVVPDANTWAAMASSALGSHQDRIQTNARGGRRLWIVDPRLRLGPAPGATLPFIQSDAGSREPTNARVVVLSSLGVPPPTTVQDGVAASNARFDALWSASPGAVPTGWSWNGRADDLAIQRLDLTDHWVPVLLNQPATGPRGQWGTDLAGTNAASPGALQTWYLRGTVLRLHDADGRLQWSVVLQTPLTLTFERGAWRGRASWLDADGHGNGSTVDDAMNRFQGAVENPEAAFATPPATREGVCRSMSNYLTAYLNWSAGGFPSTGPGVEAVGAAATLLDTQTRALLTRP
ncbi:MAG: type II secretion system protein [Verrucomicrobia bacterium]|nr:type II secretion system protein [Verrucomicrobiota bacterium]